MARPLLPATATRRAILAGVLAALPGVRPAAAHAVVTTSSPETGAALAESPRRVTLRFNSRVDHARSRLLLIGPDGTQTALELEPPAEPTLLEAVIPAAGVAWTPGSWRLRWQVLALDGHITRGDIPFTLQAP